MADTDLENFAFDIIILSAALHLPAGRCHWGCHCHLLALQNLHCEVQSVCLWHATCVMHVSALCLGLAAAFLQMVMELNVAEQGR